MPFPCQFRQNEIEFCQDEIKIARTDLNFAFVKNETEFCQKLSFATAEMNFVHAKLILFLA